MATICVDACFLIALYSPRDQRYQLALEQFEALFAEESRGHVLLAPWPILYESFKTKQPKPRGRPDLDRLNHEWYSLERAGKLRLLDDSKYRDRALGEYLEQGADRPRGISLTDRVIRAMIKDRDTGIDTLLTYNARDFADVCTRYRIRLVNENSGLQGLLDE